MRDYLLVIGVMTGNSLDGVDLVLCRVGQDLTFSDISTLSSPLPESLVRALRLLRSVAEKYRGKVEKISSGYRKELWQMATGAAQQSESLYDLPQSFEQLHEDYLQFIAAAVQRLVKEAQADQELQRYCEVGQIDLIGFHGQTCTHLSPRVAQSDDPNLVYTVQLGSGQRLADLTGIPVVYDFRSDDIFNGGEGAPLAPLHHLHLATALRLKGVFPVVFCNAGNTGNVTIVSEEVNSEQLRVFGWDSGPFNHYPDSLTRLEKGQACDLDGQYGRDGKVSPDLINLLFERSVITKDGANFLEIRPPRSSDPSWYLDLPSLITLIGQSGLNLSFCDLLRTFEYFAAYCMMHTLSFVPAGVVLPRNFVLSGGGWNNPLIREHFSGLLQGDFDNNPVLSQHLKLFNDLRNRILYCPDPDQVEGKIRVSFAREFGIDGTAMEARIFADAAVCRIKGEPFSLPAITGVKAATIDGILRFPKGARSNSSKTLTEWLEHYQFKTQSSDRPELFDQYWSRASADWSRKILAI